MSKEWGLLLLLFLRGFSYVEFDKGKHWCYNSERIKKRGKFIMKLEEFKTQKYLNQVDNGVELTYEQFEDQLRNEWMQGYNLAYRYFIFHNDLDVPLDYFIDGFPLGNFIEEQRKFKRDLTVNQVKLLDNIAMKWKVAFGHHRRRAQAEIRYGEEQYAKWLENYMLAKQFFEANGHLNIPADFVTNNEQGKKFHLGAWLQAQKHNYNTGRIPAERMSKLDTLFMVYDNTHKNEIKRILRVEDNNYLPSCLKHIDPFKTKPITAIFNKGRHRLKLERKMEYCQLYFEQHGDLKVPQNYNLILADGQVIRLGKIVTRFRSQRRQNLLDIDTVLALDNMGIEWNPKRGRKPKQNNSHLAEILHQKNEMASLRSLLTDLSLAMQQMPDENLFEFELAIEEKNPNPDEIEQAYNVLEQRRAVK